MFKLQLYAGKAYPLGGTVPCNKKSDGAEPASVEQRYDQVEFSACMDDTQRRIRKTVGRLAQEVRTQVTSQDMKNLHQQLERGDYRPDASRIAARILLLGED